MTRSIATAALLLGMTVGTGAAHAGGADPGTVLAAIGKLDAHHANEAVALLAPSVPARGTDAAARCVLGLAYGDLGKWELARLFVTSCTPGAIDAAHDAWMTERAAAIAAHVDAGKLGKVEIHGAQGTWIELSDWPGIVVQLPATVWLSPDVHTISSVIDPAGAPIEPPIATPVKAVIGQSTAIFIPTAPPQAKPPGNQTVDFGEEEAGTPPTVGGPTYGPHTSMLPKRYLNGVNASADDDDGPGSRGAPLSLSMHAGVWIEDLSGDPPVVSPELVLGVGYRVLPRVTVLAAIDVAFPIGANTVDETGGLALGAAAELWRGGLGRLSILALPRLEHVWGTDDVMGVPANSLTLGGGARLDHLVGSELALQAGCRAHVGSDAGAVPACGVDLGFTFGANRR